MATKPDDDFEFEIETDDAPPVPESDDKPEIEVEDDTPEQDRGREPMPKEIVDEVIFNSQSLRDRLLLELQSRCGARIGEVLKIRVKDVDGRKIVIHDPKSGKDVEVVFMPEPVANRLKDYIEAAGLTEEDRIFDFSYGTARAIIKDAPIWVLDEPTEGLDRITAQLMMKALHRLTEGRTLLLITHRLVDLHRMDKIVMLERGRIIAQGCHDSLLKGQTRYAALHESIL